MVRAVSGRLIEALLFCGIPNAAQSRDRQSRRKKILVGNFSLYPSNVRLEMKRIHEKKWWSHVELVVAPLEWRQSARE